MTAVPARSRPSTCVEVVVCRGCCCGDPRRDPDTDHTAQLDRLRELAGARSDLVRMRTSDCLGPCAQANVMVVVPSPAGRRRGGRPQWLAFVRDLAVLDILGRWLYDGGPGLAGMPDELALHASIPPPAAGSRERSARRRRGR